jgi:hypothetical protein
MKFQLSLRSAIDVLAHHPSLGLPAARLWEFYCMDVAGTLAGGQHDNNYMAHGLNGACLVLHTWPLSTACLHTLCESNLQPLAPYILALLLVCGETGQYMRYE